MDGFGNFIQLVSDHIAGIIETALRDPQHVTNLPAL
jgi:hypothetical protein